MALEVESIRTKGDLKRVVQEFLADPDVLPPNRGTRAFGEVAADLPAPAKGGVAYVIGNNGAGKRELRIRFPTGVPQVIATEP